MVYATVEPCLTKPPRAFVVDRYIQPTHLDRKHSDCSTLCVVTDGQWLESNPNAEEEDTVAKLKETEAVANPIIAR